MPDRPLRPCAHSGCGALTTTGRCPMHPRRDTRPPASRRGYGAAWRSLRLEILRRDPICKMCGVAPSVHVDHIIPRAQGGSDRPDNLRGLCQRDHNARTARETGGFGNPVQPR